MSGYPLLKNWTESGVTWNRYDGTNNWQTAGAGGATDRDTTSMGSRGFVASEPVGFKAIPLDVSTMQNYVNGTRADYGWLLKMDTESGFLYEFTTSDRYFASNRPRLVVEYTLPEEEPDWVNKAFTYEDEDHIHAPLASLGGAKTATVTSLVVTDENDNQTTNTYRYDANGNMTCRIEGGETFLQAYNAENRMSGVLLVTGDCDTLGDTLKAWEFTYDGDGVKVKQEYTDSSGTLTTFYYAGGAYEVQTDGTTETVRQYYAVAGVRCRIARSGIGHRRQRLHKQIFWAPLF